MLSINNTSPVGLQTSKERKEKNKIQFHIDNGGVRASAKERSRRGFQELKLLQVRCNRSEKKEKTVVITGGKKTEKRLPSPSFVTTQSLKPISKKTSKQGEVFKHSTTAEL
jgi:hypothetical protein